MSRYQPIRVPVDGGTLAGGEWVSPAENAPTVLAVHGITASHLAWPLLADALPDVRLIAPDLRGRGQSRSLPGPWGMARHADDLVRVLDATGVERAVITGHSMGAFVAVAMAHRHPDRVAGLILIDGGLPLPLPETHNDSGIPQALLGPAAARLAMTFADRESYRAFWRVHPAFTEEWNATVEDYVDYDLVGEEPEMHAASSVDAVAFDSRQLNGDDTYREALHAMQAPVEFLRAPRGLMNQLPGLYSPKEISEWREQLPSLRVHEVADVNHYTIIMTTRGAEAVGRVITDVVATRQPH